MYGRSKRDKKYIFIDAVNMRKWQRGISGQTIQ